MIKGLFRCEALADVLHDQALQKLFRLLRMLRERLVLKVELPFDDVSDDFKLRIARKRYFAT
jgi:hypothetical protein